MLFCQTLDTATQVAEERPFKGKKHIAYEADRIASVIEALKMLNDKAFRLPPQKISVALQSCERR